MNIPQNIQNAEKAIQTTREEYQSKRDRIRKNKDLSHQGISKRVLEIQKEYFSKDEKNVEAYNNAVKDHETDLQKRAFDIDGNKAEEMAYDNYTMQYADADPKELAKKVKYISNLSTARAMAKIAHAKGYNELEDKLVDKFDRLYAPVQKLTTFQEHYGSRRSRQAKIQQKMQLGGNSVPRPNGQAGKKDRTPLD